MTRTSRSATPRGDSFRARAFTTFVVFIVASCNAMAGEAPRPASSPDQPNVDGTPATASMRVAIEPGTGRITVPGADATGLPPLWSMSRLPSAPLPVVRLEDGSLMIDLAGIFLTNAVASIGWDGKPSLGCAEFGVDPQETMRWLVLPAAPARAKVRE